MSKFFVDSKQIENDIVFINGDDVNHIKNVLRYALGDDLIICNKESLENYKCEILEFLKDSIKCTIIEKVESSSESNIKLHIYQGLPKADKMELIIQKGTELGVQKFIPVALSRCIVKLSGKDESKKIERWNKISEVASKQCGRDIVPEVTNIFSIKNVCEKINDYDLFLVAYENEKENYIKKELLDIKSKLDKNKDFKIAVLIGPEGGLAEEEVNLLKENGSKVISLGNRILRTETVALNVSSIIMYELENGGF